MKQKLYFIYRHTVRSNDVRLKTLVWAFRSAWAL
jgi:hypothetical protein